MKRKTKILIAEDEAIFALSMQRVLTRSGYDVCELVSTGEKAVERVRLEKPDLVIMDVILNGRVNGLEAAVQIRSESDIPIIFVTGYEEEKLFEQIESVTSSTYLIKPTSPGALDAQEHLNLCTQLVSVATDIFLYSSYGAGKFNPINKDLRLCNPKSSESREAPLKTATRIDW